MNETAVANRTRAASAIPVAPEYALPTAEDHVVLGTTFIRINDLAGAHRQFEMAVALDEGHAKARFHLANVLSGRGDVADAVIQYERVLAIDKDNADAHQNLGLALQRIGQFEAALAHHQAALAI